MGPEAHPTDLFNSNYHWNRETLFEFAKDSFRGFKESYKGQVNEEKRARMRINEQTNRRAARRKEVSKGN